MSRIQLLVTGDMEKAALRESLQRFFPDVRGGRKVEWLTPQKLKGGVTTHQLRAGAQPSEAMITLAKALLAEARAGKTGQPADLVVAIDDLELGNLGRVGVVRQGQRALAGLRWKQVPTCGTDLRLIRSLFEDLAAWFDVPNPLGPGETHPDLFPQRTVKPGSLLLRNL